MSYFVVFSNN